MFIEESIFSMKAFLQQINIFHLEETVTEDGCTSIFS